MRSSPRLSLFAAVAILVAGAGFVAACGAQGEGERCATTNGNDDCEAGLVCVPKSVCCPQDESQATTDICRGSGAPVSDAGDETDTSDTIEVGTVIEGGLDAGCAYNSQCTPPYICDHKGRCDYECLDDRDCPTDNKYCWSGDDHTCRNTPPPTDSGTDTAPADTGSDTGTADTGSGADTTDTATADTAEAG